MTNCEGCPFLPDKEMRRDFMTFICPQGFLVQNDYYPKTDITSTECQLDIVQLSRLDLPNNITFIPKH